MIDDVVELMGPAEARERVDRVKAAVERTRADLVELWHRRAWLALSYPTWDALCDAEFAVRVALPRDERREAVAELRAEGMSTRAIGSALGLSKDTVHRDLSSVSHETDETERVVSLDGRERPATQPPRPAPAERYPELAHFDDRPAKAEVLADALDGYDDDERAVRREALAATIAAEQRNGGPLPGVTRDPDMDKADELYQLVVRAARAAELRGGPDLMARLADRIDDVTRASWAGTYADLADRARRMAEALDRPALRSVR